MEKRELNAPNAPRPAAHYSQAVEITAAARMLFISGQLGMTPDGTIAHGMTEQSRIAWRNLGAQLAAAGMTFDNVVKITLIVPDPADIPAIRLGRAEALGDRRRPASTIIVAGLPDPSLRISIEAIACA
jgi:enamine deaminase RidA (YjgF/YER057c/UK114 family)